MELGDLNGGSRQKRSNGLSNEIAALEERGNFLEQRCEWLTEKLSEHHKRWIVKLMEGANEGKLRKIFDSWARGAHECHEQRFDWLQDRNKWLEARLMEHHRKLVEKSLCGSDDMIKRRAIHAWTKAMTEFRLEIDCEKLRDDNQALLERRGIDAERIELLEKRLQEAEATVHRCRRHAQLVMDSADSYEVKRREIEQEVCETRQGTHQPLEQIMKWRREAHDTIKQVSVLLDHGRGRPNGGDPSSPDKLENSASSSPENDLSRPVPTGHTARSGAQSRRDVQQYSPYPRHVNSWEAVSPTRSRAAGADSLSGGGYSAGAYSVGAPRRRSTDDEKFHPPSPQPLGWAPGSAGGSYIPSGAVVGGPRNGMSSAGFPQGPKPSGQLIQSLLRGGKERPPMGVNYSSYR